MRKFIAWLPCMLCYWIGCFWIKIATLSGAIYNRFMVWSVRIDEWAGLNFWKG